MDYKINLKTALAKFGLAELFTEQADLSGIGPGLQLASATHQALIEVIFFRNFYLDSGI